MEGKDSVDRKTWIIVLVVLALGTSGVLLPLTDSSPTSRWYETNNLFQTAPNQESRFSVQLYHNGVATVPLQDGVIVGELANPSPTPWLVFTDYASFKISTDNGELKVWLTDSNNNPVPDDAACNLFSFSCDPKAPTTIGSGSRDVYTEIRNVTPYLIHFENVGSTVATGTLTLGVATVTSSKPGFFIGIAFLGIAALYIVPAADLHARIIVRKVRPIMGGTTPAPQREASEISNATRGDHRMLDYSFRGRSLV